MNKNVVLVAAAVLLLGAAAVVYLRTSSKPSFSKMKALGVALDTKEEMSVEFSPNEPQPWVNPKTGQRSVYAFCFCEKCKFKFVPKLEPSRDGGPPNVPMMPTCTNCGDTHVGRWIPEISDTPAGTAPLPKWPQ